MTSCYGCIYGGPIHTCLPKDSPFKPRSEFDNWQDWVEQNVGYEEPKIDQYMDKREEIKARLATMKKDLNIRKSE